VRSLGVVNAPLGSNLEETRAIRMSARRVRAEAAVARALAHEERSRSAALRPASPMTRPRSGDAAPAERETVLPDVEVIIHSATLFAFTVNGKYVRIAPDDLLPGTTVVRAGDRGRVVIPRWLAEVLEIA
jgi:hypothetical protein